MNPFGMPAGDIPEDVMDRDYDVATVFKNFKNTDHGRTKPVSRETGHSTFVVEVRKAKRLYRER